MGEVDFVLIIVLIFGCIAGFFYGLIRQIGTLFAVWAGILFSGILSPIVSGWIMSVVNVSPVVLYLFSFIISFIIIACGIQFAMIMLLKCVSLMGGGFLNRVLGGAMGLIIMVLLISVGMNICERFFPDHHWSVELKKSDLGRTISHIAPNVVPRLSLFFDKSSEIISDFISNGR